jgi:hypothetical protein
MKAVRWGIGGTLLVAGAGWIGYMLWYFVRLNLHLEPSWDISLTYWYPCACVTFPFAMGAAVTGVWVLRRNRTRSQ